MFFKVTDKRNGKSLLVQAAQITSLTEPVLDESGCILRCVDRGPIELVETFGEMEKLLASYHLINYRRPAENAPSRED